VCVCVHLFSRHLHNNNKASVCIKDVYSSESSCDLKNLNLIHFIGQDCPIIEFHLIIMIIHECIYLLIYL
jgi:hypothetical protein